MSKPGKLKAKLSHNGRSSEFTIPDLTDDKVMKIEALLNRILFGLPVSVSWEESGEEGEDSQLRIV